MTVSSTINTTRLDELLDGRTAVPKGNMHRESLMESHLNQSPPKTLLLALQASDVIKNN